MFNLQFKPMGCLTRRAIKKQKKGKPFWELSWTLSVIAAF